MRKVILVGVVGRVGLVLGLGYVMKLGIGMGSGRRYVDSTGGGGILVFVLCLS